jgi:hypothetical protein
VGFFAVVFKSAKGDACLALGFSARQAIALQVVCVMLHMGPQLFFNFVLCSYAAKQG